MARRRFRKAGFNQKLIMDVGLAGVAVRVIPILLNKFVPLDPTIYTVAGAGGGYLVGSMLKKPDLANASIALGLVEFVAPMIENLVGGIGTPVNTPVKLPGRPTGMVTLPQKKVSVDDYQYGISLNDYVSNPSLMPGDAFRHSYSSNVY